MSETAPSPASDEASVEATPDRPSFAFAKRHGVLVSDAEDGRLLVRHRPDVSLTALAEVRRFLRRSFVLETVPVERFNALLTAAYDNESSQTMQLIGDLGEDTDRSPHGSANWSWLEARVWISARASSMSRKKPWWSRSAVSAARKKHRAAIITSDKLKNLCNSSGLWPMRQILTHSVYRSCLRTTP